jgi:hypothetical protein
LFRKRRDAFVDQIEHRLMASGHKRRRYFHVHIERLPRPNGLRQNARSRKLAIEKNRDRHKPTAPWVAFPRHCAAVFNPHPYAKLRAGLNVFRCPKGNITHIVTRRRFRRARVRPGSLSRQIEKEGIDSLLLKKGDPLLHKVEF